MTALLGEESERTPAGSASNVHSQRNAVRRLIRCLFAEGILDLDHIEQVSGADDARLTLGGDGGQLIFERLTVAPARTVLVSGPIVLCGRGVAPKVVDDPGELLELLAVRFDFNPSSAGLALVKKDIANSVVNDIAARQCRVHWNFDLARRIRRESEHNLPNYLRHHASVRENIIFLDQWGALEGHPFYPTWKTRPGLPAADVAALSPEFGARVRVRIAALREDTAYVELMPGISDVRSWFASAFPEAWEAWRAGLMARKLDVAAWLPLPIHIWHLEAFVRDHFAADVVEGTLILDGPEIDTAPSMSYRTMMPEGPPAAPFIKLPIALWMTSEQRSLQAKSIHMGPRNSAIIGAILEREQGFDGLMAIFPEEVAYHYRHATLRDDTPGKNLSVVFRATTEIVASCEGHLPVPVAALFTSLPETERPFITALIESDGQKPERQHVERFFRAYTRTVVRPVLAIYLLYGVGLEAHQQNTSVVFDAENQPRKILVRDFGDGRTFAPLLESRGFTLKPYVNPPILPTVFRDDIEPVRTFVIDACFVCHLHEIALTLTNEYELPDDRLWQILREETDAAFGAVADRLDASFLETERAIFLEAPWSTRSVLRMHLTRYTDYRLQHKLPNPLALNNILSEHA